MKPVGNPCRKQVAPPARLSVICRVLLVAALGCRRAYGKRRKHFRFVRSEEFDDGLGTFGAADQQLVVDGLDAKSDFLGGMQERYSVHCASSSSVTCVRPAAPSRRSSGGPSAGAGPRVTGTRRRKAGSSGKSSGSAGWLMAATCRQSVFRSPRDRSLDRSRAPDRLASTLAWAGVCLSVRSVCAGTDARARFVSAFSRTDWTDGQIVVFCPVVSCVCADGASVSRTVRTFDDRTDATDWRGVPRLLLPFLVLLGGLAGGGGVGGGDVGFLGGQTFFCTLGFCPPRHSAAE